MKTTIDRTVVARNRPHQYKTKFSNPNDPSVQTIIRMIGTEGATLQEVGRVLGISREAVRQDIRSIRRKLGIDVFAIRRQNFYTVSEVAAMFSLSGTTVKKYCRDGKIPCVCSKNHKHYFMSDESIRQLIHLLISKSGPKHREKKNFRAEWIKVLEKRLANIVADENEQMIGHSEAMRISGLSNGRVSYLRKIKVVKSFPLPGAMHLGRFPVYLYLQKEMELAGQVVFEFGIQ